MSTQTVNYSYSYGAGGVHNRNIEFFWTNPQDKNSIKARITALHQGTSIILNEISGKDISIEMMSTSQKANAMMQARNTFTNPIYPPNESLASQTLGNQIQILNALNANGSGKKIEIENDVGGPNGLELVTNLIIIDPR